jgi:TctA family transporter
MADILVQLWGGFAVAFQPINLMLIIFGCTVGLFIGAMPGLGSVNGVAILLPLTFGAPEEFSLMLLAFATFVGLGGDDIAKTIFSICIGLVLSAVGLDIISGELHARYQFPCSRYRHLWHW